MGARLRVGYEVFELTLAAARTAARSATAVFPALAPSRTKEIVGRLGTNVEVMPKVTLEAGVSADTGNGLPRGHPDDQGLPGSFGGTKTETD